MRRNSDNARILIEHLSAHHFGLLSEKAYSAGDVGECAVLLFHEELLGGKSAIKEAELSRARGKRERTV